MGKVAPLAAPPKEPMAVALPLRQTNHSEIRVVGIRVRDPCPRVRIRAKPTYNFQGWSTELIHRAARPKRTPTIASIIRAPYLSSRRPTSIMATPAVREPAEYIPETIVRVQPMSEMMGSTNMETE
jgi:hypothetical protein